MSRLNGKIAVVTGASKGIGAEIARQLGKEGATVVVNYASSKAAAERIVNDINSNGGGKAVAIQADLAKDADIVRLFDEVRKSYGRVDTLVNNAGVYEFGALETITPEHFRKQFDVNVLGLLLATREAAKLMGEGSSIINIGSIVGRWAAPGAAVYSATKAAVDSVTVSLSRELGQRKIRVNALNPGMVETDGLHASGIAGSDFRKQVEAATPFGRIGQPEDIARAVVFLASDDSAWVTGETIVASGGQRA